MERLKYSSIIVLLFLSLALNGYFVLTKQHENTVTDVHDGDTFTLADGQRVRLLGANAPELGRCGSLEAKQLLTDLVLGKVVRIEEEKRDMYGRRMGLVYTGSTLVNERLIGAGYARPDYAKNSRSDTLKNAYAYATENRLGIHSNLCKSVPPIPPSEECVIKGNIDKATGTHLYHLPTCRHYNQIVLDSDTGEGFFCSENDAQDAGFTLAPDCLR